MQELSPSFFFSLEKYSHKMLFENISFVWEALTNILPYLQKTSLGNIESPVPSSTHLVHPELISIGKETIIEPGAYIQGPCIIGSNCQVRHGAYIRGGVITGDGCVIGHATEVKHAIFLDRAHAAHFNYVGDSILGSDANLGAGSKLANLRLDREEIFFLFQGQKISTGLKKFGAIVGDGAQIGCNAVANPGTLIPPGKGCLPNHNVSGFVGMKNLVKT